MKRSSAIILFFFAFCSLISAQEAKKDTINVEIAISDTLTNEFLDSLDIRKKVTINDYSMVGVQYGVGLSQVMWNPKYKQDMLILPVNFGVTYTRYGKMFGYMPFFGFQIGLMYGKEGYQFEYDNVRIRLKALTGRYMT